MIAVGVFLLGLLAAIAMPFEILFPQRIIVGKSRVQIVRKGSSGDRVELSIPYYNLKRATHEKDGDDWYVGLDLYDLDDPDTYAEPRSQIEKKKEKGRDATIDGGFTASLKEIADILKDRIVAAKRKREADEDDGDDEPEILD